MNVIVAVFAVTLICCVSCLWVFQMVVLDVLIIGGGPHALTLASLLSSPETDTSSDRGHDPLLTPCSSEPQKFLQKTELSRNNGSNGKRKKKTTPGKI